MCGLVSLLLLHRKVTFVDFFPNTRVFLFFLMHIVVSHIFFIYVRFDSISAFKRSPPLFVHLLNRVTIARLLLLLLWLFSHVFCSEDSHFLTGGHIVPVSPFFSVKGTKSETRSLFSSLCVFHFIIMQKIYYIRVVFVCCCWFRSRSREGTNL